MDLDAFKSKKSLTKFFTDIFKESYYLIPIMLMSAFVPLIVFLKKVPVGKDIVNYWTSSVNTDFFSYYKMTWFIFFTFLLFLFVMTAFYNGDYKIKYDKIYIPILIYLLFAFLSAVFSKYIGISFFGFPDRYEGFFVILCYILVMIFISQGIKSYKSSYIVTAGLLFSGFFITVIGLLQFIGKFEFDGYLYEPLDLFKTEFGRYLILPKEFHDMAKSLKFNFGENTIYSTLYNTNFVGSYTALLLPFTLVYFFKSKRIRYTALFFFFSVMFFSNWIGCLSRTGWIGGSIALILTIILLNKTLLAKWKRTLSITIAFLITLLLMNSISGSILSNQAKKLDTAYEAEVLKGTDKYLADLIIDNNKLKFITPDGGFILSINATAIEFTDFTGKALELFYKKETGIISFRDKKYQAFNFAPIPDSKLIRVFVNQIQLIFAVTDRGLKFVNNRNELVDLKNAESIGFKGREKLGSMRGYIWSRTLPIMKNTILLGKGPDTYGIYFPQNDYVKKLIFFNNPFMIVDKPHNIFLQIGVNTGVISLIAFAAFFLLYLFQSLKKLFTAKEYNEFHVLLAASTTGMTGYLVTGFANDSLISVAPVFWIVSGLGLGALIALKQTSINNSNKKS